jgi:hypothetical protein
MEKTLLNSKTGLPMKISKMLPLTPLFIAGLIGSSEPAKALECFELGAGAELSLMINTHTKKGSITTGESETPIWVKRQSVGGSLFTYRFRFEGRRFSLNVLNEPVDEQDSRSRAILTDLYTAENIPMGCNL